MIDEKHPVLNLISYARTEERLASAQLVLGKQHRGTYLYFWGWFPGNDIPLENAGCRTGAWARMAGFEAISQVNESSAEQEVPCRCAGMFESI